MLRGNAPHHKDHLRAEQLYLRVQKGGAAASFLRRRVTVLRRAAFNHIGDIAVGFARKLNSLQHLVEELPRPTDKGSALPVFVRARSLADYHHLNGVGQAGQLFGAFSRHRMSTGLPQYTGGALRNRSVNLLHRPKQRSAATTYRLRIHSAGSGAAC